MAAELDGTGKVVSTFVYGMRPNVPDAMVRAGKTYRIVSDWRGSVRAVVDASAGTVIESIDYDAWGVATVKDATCATGAVCAMFQPFGFAGGLFDRETGLVRFGARDYDASVGRWTQRDSSRFGGGINLYNYASNDGVDHIDPTGQFWWIVAGAALGAGADLGLQLYGNGGDFSQVNWGEVAVWGAGGALAGVGGEFLFGSAFSATSQSGALVAVTQYGGAAAAASPWVIVGGNTVRNWIMSGSPELGYEIGSGVTTFVNEAELAFPAGIECAKGLLGQRIYTPAGLP